MDARLSLPAHRIGLTGGIGSGKSTVAAMLARHGAVVIDTDLIARQLTQPGGAAIDALRHAFGAEVVNASGALDRARMRALVFSDGVAKQRLEAILHPMIGTESERQASSAGAAAVVFDVPLLVESGRWRARVDKVLVVDCQEATQLARVAARTDWTMQAARAVIDRQASRTQRRSSADAVIYNDAITLEQLCDLVHCVWQRWTTPPD